jgi:hypothetical protein
MHSACIAQTRTMSATLTAAALNAPRAPLARLACLLRYSTISSSSDMSRKAAGYSARAFPALPLLLLRCLRSFILDSAHSPFFRVGCGLVPHSRFQGANKKPSVLSQSEGSVAWRVWCAFTRPPPRNALRPDYPRPADSQIAAAWAHESNQSMKPSRTRQRTTPLARSKLRVEGKLCVSFQ